MIKKNESENINSRRAGGLMPVGLDMRFLAKNVLGKRGFSNVDLIAHWRDIVGETLSEGVKPDKITYPKNERINGTLCVRVQGGAFATMFEHQKNIVLDKINTFLGYQALSNIKILQDNQIELKSKAVNLPQQPLTEAQHKKLLERTADIKDEQLRQQMYEIGKKLFSK